MDYRARFYDSSIGRFIQPDTLIPGPTSPQSWNRYSYVTNRPTNLNDPTGNKGCDSLNDKGQCQSDEEKGIGYYKDKLKKKYDWDMKGNWSSDELEKLNLVAEKISSYVNKISGSTKGADWIKAYLGNVAITHRSSSDPLVALLAPKGYAVTLPGSQSRTGQTTIYLDAGWVASQLTHEFGHVWDINTAEKNNVLGPIGGVADKMNSFLGGGIEGSLYPRWINTQSLKGWNNPYIPDANFFEQQNPYGNGATGDYLAETFRWSIYNENNLPDNRSGQMWMNTVIALEVSTTR